MESDSKKINKIKRSIFDAGNVLSSIWVRLSVQISNGGEWLILGGRHHFLWNFRMFLAVIYFTFKTFEKFIN